MLDCTEYYKINNAATGLVLTDAAFLTNLNGKAKRAIYGSVDGGFPVIKCVLGVESLVSGIATRTPGFVVLSGRGGGLDANEDRYLCPIPFLGIGTTEVQNPDDRGRRYDENMLNMPWPEGSTLCDGTVSKLFGCGANTYSAFVLYRQFGAKCPPPQGNRSIVVAYTKTADYTTIIWTGNNYAAKNAAGELLPDHKYRLLYVSSSAEDAELNLIRITVPGYPSLIAPGCGSVVLTNATYGGAGKVYFLDDSIMIRGDAAIQIEGHVGAVNLPVIYLCWEDMGKI